ncbi:hypothetical protein Tco_0793147 [Tanacetum coccineum]
MTGDRSYLTDYEEIDGGFVAFGDFKLSDESHVLIKVPRKDNMYRCNGYPRKGQKSKPNRQNQARERKERKRKVKSKPKVNKKPKSNQVKVNPGKWIRKEHRKQSPKI